VVREGLRLMLALDPALEIVGEAANGADAVRLARELRPDLVLMDLQMPGMDGIAATKAIKEALPGTEVLVLTSILEDAAVVGAVRAGAIGYLHKDTEGDELRRAIHAAAAGQVQLTPQAAAWLLQELRPSAEPAAPPADRFTPRERDTLRLLVQGLSNREIGAALSVGEKTVKTHVRNILHKLGVRSRTQAVLEAQRLGFVALPGAPEQTS
jgi:DNA-binding NarL/FixJ family response regulator